VLGLEPHRVRVIAPDVGGGFGAKLIVYPEDVLIPLLAMRFGRPVRWLEDRVEHMLTATQERTQTHTVEVGFDDEGRVLALRDEFVHDTGADTPRGLVVHLILRMSDRKPVDFCASGPAYLLRTACGRRRCVATNASR
jgi:aerobic carbon-monoxide dehydrogenase large subunit